MRYQLVFQSVIVLFTCTTLMAKESLHDLRQQFTTAKVIDKAGVSKISIAEFINFSERALIIADGAGERGKFWSAIGFAAELCETAPYEVVNDVRTRALNLLVQRFTDTGRWSTLISSRFSPILEKIPKTFWRHQIKIYDEILHTLIESTGNERIKAELYHAKTFLRVQINRRWDWLTKSDRVAAIQLLNFIQEKYGSLPRPGSRNETGATVGVRANDYEYELERLHFNALAPTTKGVDLEGKSLDIADLKGKIVLLDFWTSFCTPCMSMVPDTKRLLEKYSGEPIVLVGVSGDSQQEQSLRTAKRMKMTWRNLWDGNLDGPHGPIATIWRVNSWPTLIAIDRNSRIRYKFSSKEQLDHGLESAINALLKEHERQP